MHNLRGNIQWYFVVNQSRDAGRQLIYAQRFLKSPMNTNYSLQVVVTPNRNANKDPRAGKARNHNNCDREADILETVIVVIHSL